MLTRPGAEQLVGPEPTNDRGFPIAPLDAVGHDHLWWLDRIVRTTTPLVERMTLNWHDWFATSNRGVGSEKLILDQNDTLRTNALGSFQDLLLVVTVDPAMLHWLNGDQNTRLAPNENYGRELMELFTLGADRPGARLRQWVLRSVARADLGGDCRCRRACLLFAARPKAVVREEPALEVSTHRRRRPSQPSSRV